MDRRSLVLVSCAVACSVPTPRAQLASVAPDPSLRAPTCITRSAEQYPPHADSVAITGDAVTLCFGVESGRSCWHVDLATKVFAPRPVVPPHTASPVKNENWRAIPDGDTLRIYDRASATLRAVIHGWSDSPMAGDQFNYLPTFVTPDRMIVWYAWTPVSEQGRIFDMSGRQLAIVGTDFVSIDPDKNVWHVHGTEWAIKGESNELLTVDVTDPRVTSTYELSPLLALPRPPKDSDTGALDVLAVAGTATRLVIVTGENPTTIGILDRATHRLEKLEPPRCVR